jgi:hypothetical protein
VVPCTYGEKVWILYKDVCKQSMVGLSAVLRAHQLGFIADPEKVKPEDIPSLVAKVRKRLPLFAAAAPYNKEFREDQA